MKEGIAQIHRDDISTCPQLRAATGNKSGLKRHCDYIAGMVMVPLKVQDVRSMMKTQETELSLTKAEQAMRDRWSFSSCKGKKSFIIKKAHQAL